MPYVYAVTETANGAGHAVRCGRLAAIVGEGPDVLQPDERSLRHHEAVVEAAMRHGPVLPMRFGSVVDDVEALLRSREDEFSAALERVRGCVELGVRVSEPDGVPAPETGTEYLMRRAAVARVEEELGGMARASARRRRGFAFLVEREREEEFRNRAAELPTVLVVTGPWPPYSFV
jgi:hypothetical protein